MTGRWRGLVLVGLCALLAACSEERAAVPPAERSGNRYVGKQLLERYGCAACHRIQGMPLNDSQAGPPLERIARASYVAGVLPNTQQNLERWIMHPRAVSPGTSMPDLGVSAAEARDMAAYLYSQEPR